MLLPRHFVNKPYFLARRFVRSAVSIKDVGSIASIEIRHGFFQELIKNFRCRTLIDTIPIKVLRRFRPLIVDNPTVFRRPSRVLARIDGKRRTIFCIRYHTLFVRLFVFKEFLVRQITVNGRRIGNAERRNPRLETRVRALDGTRNVVRVAARAIKILHGGTLGTALVL